MTGTDPWRNMTHDWSASVDVRHLERVRADPGGYAPSGVLHLLLEVVAYCADEAEVTGAGHAVLTLHGDGSMSVADDGRGTDTRRDARGMPVRKPVMATADLRFVEAAGAPLLPDGHPRRGMSVVAALSRWLVHENRRRNGSWTQRYDLGVPVTDLTAIPDDGTTGTTVHFQPATHVARLRPLDADALAAALHGVPPWLDVRVVDDR